MVNEEIEEKADFFFIFAGVIKVTNLLISEKEYF